MNGKIFLYIISSLLLVGLISVAVYFITRQGNGGGKGLYWACDQDSLSCIQNAHSGTQGSHENQSDCQDSCVLPITLQKYGCLDNQCIKTKYGKYKNKDECQQSDCASGGGGGGGVGGGKRWKCDGLIGGDQSCKQTGHSGEQNTWALKANCESKCNKSPYPSP